MFYVERVKDDGTVELMMTSPHRATIDDLRPPPGPSHINQGNGAFYMNEWPSPGNKTVFAGLPGWTARVRWNDIVIETYDWAEVPENEFDPETRYLWGWKLASENRSAVPFEELHPLSFVG